MAFSDKYSDDFIDDYLMNNLDDVEKQAFETDLRADTNLSDYVNSRKLVIASVLAYGESQLLDSIKNTETSLDEEGFFITDDDIDIFLSGQATLSENRKIEMLCLKNEAFQQRVTERRTLIEGIEYQAAKELKTNIKGVEKALEATGFFEQQTPQQNTKKEANMQGAEKQIGTKNNRRILAWTAIAASFLILVLAGRFWLFNNKEQPVYQSYFVALDDKLSPKIDAELSETGFGGSPAASLKSLKQGMAYYQTKRYKDCIPVLREYLKHNPMAANSQEVQLYLAVSHLSLGHSKDALPFLLALSASQPHGEIAADSQWYLALCYLQNEQESNGKAILEILKSGGKYKEPATRLLHALN